MISLGTRFLAVDESIAHDNYIRAILDTRDTGTVITNRRLAPTRSLKTPFTASLLELEAKGAVADDIRNFLGYSRARTAQLQGDLENAEAYCGTSAGLIKEILPVAEVMKRLVHGYREIMEKTFR